ncbi:MAG: phosphatidate cytidylyltransferase, partial [Ignavibacteria bacterium]|nr:phosphatidate cytidylyltransferase [Ignavibacteria bacterium]
MLFPNLSIRVLVSAIAIPIILLLSYLGDLFFLVFVCAIIVLGLIEFFSLTKIELLSSNGILSLIFVLLTANLFYSLTTKHFIFYLFLFVAVVSIAELFKTENKSIYNLSVTIFGAVLIGLFYSTLIGIREFYLQFSNEDYYKGGYIIITIFSTIWICDSAAYFGGLSLGKHRLLERISPKKSWEGAIFGFVFSIISVVIAKLVLLDFLSW